VVVLGDLARSPRMQYHALALAARGVDVDAVGYTATGAPVEPVAHPRVTYHLLRPPSLRARKGMRGAAFVPAALVDTVVSAVRLSRTLLWHVGRPDVILVQNPPALPTLPAALLAARAHRARLVIDWHNLGYTMLALRLEPGQPVVRLARWCEESLGRRAHAHLAVSRALRAALVDGARLGEVAVFHDRPAAGFAPLAAEEREAVRGHLYANLRVPGGAGDVALVVSPTSWTADEDFDLLIKALPLCARSVGVPVLLLVTGDGPRRSTVEARIAQLHLGRIHVRTAWLARAEYQRVLGAADLGLCLHRSSSGLDLPMKISDMIGAQLPVLALDYGACLRERLPPGDTHLLFHDARGLAADLGRLLEGFPTRTPLLDTMRAAAQASRGPTWEHGWESEAWPVLHGSRPAP
jgi:beta-1,4-mannosyltransferase